MKKRSLFIQFLLYVLLVIVMLFFIGPIVWFFMLSIRPALTNRTIPPTVIFKPTFEYFYYCFINPGVSLKYLISSLIVSFGSSLLSMPFSILSSYAISRFEFKGKKFITLFYLSLFFGPPVAYLIPYFLIVSRIGLAETYLSMILIYQTFAIPFSILIMKGFFDEVPVEIEEAAMVDGTDRLGALIRVVIPISLPGIIVSSLFAFTFSWNNAVFPLVLSGYTTKPLPIGTFNFFATTGVAWNNIAVTSVITMLPPMIIFMVLGKYIVRGLTFGAIK